MRVEVAGAEVHVGTGGTHWREGEPALLFVHGAGMDHTVWVLLARYFARRGFSVVAPDLPGHGRSAGTPLTSIAAQADWLWTLIDRLQADAGLDDAPLVLAGHSMGSLVALEAASRHTDRLSRLLLLGSAWPMPVSDALLDAAQTDIARAADMITEFAHAYASKLGHNPVAGIRVTGLANRLLQRSAPGVLASDLAACNDYAGGEAACNRAWLQPDCRCR